MAPLARSNLLTELERLEACGAEMPGAAGGSQDITRRILQGRYRRQDRLGNPARYFFAPLEPLLTDGEPEHANSGRILRGSLSPIWEWITRDLLPTMARDYVKGMNEMIAAGNQRQARLAAATFQTKVVKSIEGTLGSPDGADQVRSPAGDLYGVAGGLCRPDQDNVRAARPRRAGKVQRCAAGDDPEIG